MDAFQTELVWLVATSKFKETYNIGSAYFMDINIGNQLISRIWTII